MGFLIIKYGKFGRIISSSINLQFLKSGHCLLLLWFFHISDSLHSQIRFFFLPEKNVLKSRAVMDLELDFYLKCKVFWQFGWRIVSQETFTQSFSFSFCNHTASTRRNRHGTSSSENFQLYFRRGRKKENSLNWTRSFKSE